MKYNRIKRAIAVVLIFAISTCSFSEHILADGVQKVTLPDHESTREDAVIEKTVNTTTFINKDGLKELVIHGYNVRYENDDHELVDYDPSLVEITEEEFSDYAYTNKSEEMKHYLPKNIAKDTPFVMNNGKYQIKFRPIFKDEKVPMYLESETVEIIEQQKAKKLKNTDDIMLVSDEEEQYQSDVYTINATNIDSKQVEDITVSSEVIENIYEDEVEISNTATYNVAKSDISLEYKSLENGIKENIILEEVPESNVFSYELNIGNLIP